MIKNIDLKSWNRKTHFDFFNSYEDPFFNLTAQVDVTQLFQAKKTTGISFFLGSLYCSLQASNRIEAFRYRIRGDKVWMHDTIHTGCTIIFENHTFGFCYFPFKDQLTDFCREGAQHLEKALNAQQFEPRDDDDALTHHSVIPWVTFSQVKHPRKSLKGDSIPKIVFGKYFQQGNRMLMPVSVEAHHGLMDGYHVSEYFTQMQEILNSEEITEYDAAEKSG